MPDVLRSPLQIIRMPERETLGSRVTRLESTMADLAEKMTILVDTQIRTERQLAKVDRAARERDRRLDDRIEKLVTAIAT